MTTFSYKQIIADARVALGHNDVTSSISQLMNTIDQLTFDEIIRRSIIPSARQLLMVAPKEKVEWKMLTTTDAVSKDNYFEVPLPADYLRIGSAKLKSWSYPLSATTLIDTMEYHAQFSEYAGLRATPKKPVMAIVEGAIENETEVKNCMMLQMFGCYESDEIAYVTYVGEPKKKDITITDAPNKRPDATTGDKLPISDQRDADEKVGIEYSSYLYWPLVYMVASSVAKTLKDTNTASVMAQTCNDLMTDRETAITEAVSRAQQQNED